ncbi:hypothetical protein BXY70_2325 [Roseovarius halotolerans]|uniref:Helix-turn-helix domain protein n=1 Tax=Roseovarius halotolerans TaxID=505353 RepID=A0A1X6Z7T9_9RHOB|nr:hypothetical protein [Roseovarius halotolerans]RKT30338.1 hypothetical protein BXY70_2325 [Roseovarius halotolerans]SLN43167.1 hypothetical protein ROH8110_02222 [Roseovarius halotolerans]
MAVRQIAVKDTTAASMLDLSAPEFRRLVEVGALPQPCRIGGHERWRVDMLEAVVNGDAAMPEQEFEL